MQVGSSPYFGMPVKSRVAAAKLARWLAPQSPAADVVRFQGGAQSVVDRVVKDTKEVMQDFGDWMGALEPRDHSDPFWDLHKGRPGSKALVQTLKTRGDKGLRLLRQLKVDDFSMNYLEDAYQSCGKDIPTLIARLENRETYLELYTQAVERYQCKDKLRLEFYPT